MIFTMIIIRDKMIGVLQEYNLPEAFASNIFYFSTEGVLSLYNLTTLNFLTSSSDTFFFKIKI